MDNQRFLEFDRKFINSMRACAIPTLRVTLGLVFLWFGALKVFGVSPVADLITSTYSFFPPLFVMVLGIWEVAVGFGLIFRFALRSILALLWLQMAGTFASLVLNPTLFFHGNIFLLTTEGEFVVKNIVLVAASLVVGGHEVEAKTQPESHA